MSISHTVGELRHKLLEAATSNDTIRDPYSETAYLKKVVAGEMPLVLTVHSADIIAAILKVKTTVEAELKSEIRMVIIGGAESHVLAAELAAAKVGVVLNPAQAYAFSWDQRRSLFGAPLTNGTTIDALVDAGVVTAIGLQEDWVMRDLALLAGIAFKNGEGRLSEKEALALISTNVYKMLGISEPKEAGGTDHFVVSEGSPLDIGSRIRVVGSGERHVTVFA